MCLQAQVSELKVKHLQEELKCQRQNAETSRCNAEQRRKDMEREHQRVRRRTRTRLWFIVSCTALLLNTQPHRSFIFSYELLGSLSWNWLFCFHNKSSCHNVWYFSTENCALKSHSDWRSVLCRSCWSCRERDRLWRDNISRRATDSTRRSSRPEHFTTRCRLSTTRYHGWGVTRCSDPAELTRIV